MLVTALLTAALLSGGVLRASSAAVSAGNALELLLHCTPFDTAQGSCDFRLRQAKAVLDFEARLGEFSLPKPKFIPYPEPGDIGAILFLIDTSDPARGSVVAKNADQIVKLMAHGAPHHRFGLARFDANYHLVSPLGSSPEQLRKATQEIRARGRTTELYRNTLQALDTLANYPARRRALFIFSDGIAEDRAYFHRDVVEKARQHQITIYGLGFARSVSQSVALQTLRRLSDETGGVFQAADGKRQLAADFMAAPFTGLDRGGRIVLDLSGASTAGLANKLPLTIVAHTAGASYPTTVQIHLPPAAAPESNKAIAAPAPVPATTPLATPTIITRPMPAPPPPARQTKDSVNPLLWISLLGAFALVGGGFAFLHNHRRTETKTDSAVSKPAPASATPKVQAFVDLKDGSERHMEIRGDCFCIGRHSDNELILDDSSISRHHAEIRRQKEGSFRLTDLNSLNGAYVNGVPVDTAIIKDGDTLELGDISMEFGTLSARDDEVTMMLKSARPVSQMASGKDEETEVNNG